MFTRRRAQVLAHPTTPWAYWENWDALDPKGSSARGQMSLCVNTISAPDPCSGTSYLRGSDY